MRVFFVFLISLLTISAPSVNGSGLASCLSMAGSSHHHGHDSSMVVSAIDHACCRSLSVQGQDRIHELAQHSRILGQFKQFGFSDGHSCHMDGCRTFAVNHIVFDRSFSEGLKKKPVQSVNAAEIAIGFRLASLMRQVFTLDRSEFVRFLPKLPLYIALRQFFIP